jgi:hypothetical protein
MDYDLTSTAIISWLFEARSLTPIYLSMTFIGLSSVE